MKDRVIFSREHNAWWAADSHGYVNNEAAAGRYTLEEAQGICFEHDEFHYYAPEKVEHLLNVMEECRSDCRDGESSSAFKLLDKTLVEAGREECEVE